MECHKKKEKTKMEVTASAPELSTVHANTGDETLPDGTKWEDTLRHYDDDGYQKKTHHDEEESKDREEGERELSVQLARKQYLSGDFRGALNTCEMIYQVDARRKDNLLLMGAVHFQLRNFSESIFYNQQAIRVDGQFAEAYGNLGNALRELGDTKAAVEFYLKAIKLKPRFSDAYNNLASAYMQMGRTKQALETYRMALVLNPNLVNAQSNMGNLLKAQGKLEDARRCYLEAIRIRPDFAIAWSNIAGLFKSEGELDTAIAYYQEAVRLAPELADAHSNMGSALKEAGRLKEAEDAYKKAIELRPDFAIAHGNLGNVYYDMGHMDKAISCYKHALLLEPNFPDALNNLGNALVDIGDEENAMKKYRACIKIKPDHPHAYNNLGNLLRNRGMVKEAMHCFMTACRLMPKFAGAHSNLASILKEQGKLEQSLAHYQECISIDPKFVAGYCNLGNAYKDMGRLTDAIKCFTTAIRLDPNFPVAYNNLGCSYRDGGRFDDAISCFRKAVKLKPEYADAKINLIHTLAMICDWRSRDGDAKNLAAIMESQLAMATKFQTKLPNSILPTLSVQPFHTFAFSLTEMGDKTGEKIMGIGKAFAKQAERVLDLQNIPKFTYKARLPDDRLRIGYVSSQFGSHPISFLMQGVFSQHSDAEFEVYCYATTGDDKSRVRKRIEREAEHFRVLEGLSGLEAAKIIHTDGIHVLVNLDGYSKGCRNDIFALRPAPIQISLLNNFCGPMCADYIQYTIVDKELMKAVDCRHDPEHKLIVLPRTFMVADHKESARYVLDAKQLPRRTDFGLEDDQFVMACFNRSYKIDPNMFACWCKILERVPNAVLWMLNSPPIAQTNLKAEARARGLREERIVFSDLLPRKDHMKRVGLADLFLETPICNGQSTAADILWAGVPMITCVPEKGGRMASRASASLLQDVGLEELIVKSLTEYEELCFTLATKTNRIFELRKRLEANRIASATLFDSASYVENLQAAIRQVWKLRESGQTPDDIIL